MKKVYVIKVKELVTVEYAFEAESEAEARRMYFDGDVTEDYWEIDNHLHEILSIKEVVIPKEDPK